MAHTLATIRRRVLARFGDLVVVKATQNGTTTTLIDENTLVGQPGRFSAREILFTSGDNAGESRLITASSRDNSSITFAQPLPHATATGDEADITNAYGIGVSFRALHDAINYALDVARDYALTPMSYDVPDAYDDDDGSPLVMPPEMIGVSQVMWQGDRRNSWRQVKRANSFGDNGWSLDKPNHALFLNGPVATQTHGRSLRVYGYTFPEPLVNDTDTTDVDIEWLVDAATAHLCLDTLLSRQSSSDWGSKGLYYSNRADSIRSRLTPVLSPSFERF